MTNLKTKIFNSEAYKISFLFIISILVVSFLASPILATMMIWDESNIIETATMNSNINLGLTCEGAMLMDETSGTILYAKNEHEKLRPASVTKVMTLLLIMEALDDGRISLTDKVSCSPKASSMGGSQIWLDQTESLTVDEMLKAICVVSANDCCVAMSEFIAGSEEAFVDLMNAKAKELDMNDTTFKNCHGIDEDGHLTSAYDIALMSRELSKNHPQIHNYTKIWMDTLRDGKSQLVNTNKLVRFYSGCTGLKTGSTSLALYNLSATATRNNLSLIAVVLKGPTPTERFDDAKKLLDYGFSNFSNVVIAKKADVVDTMETQKSKTANVEIILEDDLSVLLKKGNEKNITKEIIYDKEIAAPLEYREKVGVMHCYLDGEIVATGNLLSNQKIEKKDIVQFSNDLLNFFLKIGR